MAAFLKFALVIVALVCFMESVEMTRIRRDDTEADNTDIFQSLIETLGAKFEQSVIFKEFKEIMKEFSADDAKKFIDKVTSATKEEIQKAKETE